MIFDFILQLYCQIDELKREAQQKGAEADATRQELQNELTLKVCYPRPQCRCVVGLMLVIS
jgi:hypothetical protein